MAKLVTTTQLSELLSVSRTTLSKGIKEGWLTVAARDSRGRPLFNPAVAGKEYSARGDHGAIKSRHREGKSHGGRPTKNPQAASPTAVTAISLETMDPGSGTDFSDFSELLRSVQDIDHPAQRILFMEAVKKAWDARNSMLRAMREDGTLVPIQKVKTDGAELGTVLISSLQALPDRLADRLAAMNNARAIHELIMDEINLVIREIRKRCGSPDIDEGAEIAQA
ncbi:MAG: DUF1441 family protein [Planctomycetaceae bacterium]|nr:DUF1441 family protein [Planctomycetaceae bacterium]